MQNVDRLTRKLETAAARVPPPIVDGTDGSIGVIAYGTTHDAIVEARDQLRTEESIDFDYMRIRAFPFDRGVADWILAHDVVYVVEQNRDGQMAKMLQIEFPELGTRVQSIRHYDGMPVDARSVTEGVVAAEAARTGGA